MKMILVAGLFCTGLVPLVAQTVPDDAVRIDLAIFVVGNADKTRILSGSQMTMPPKRANGDASWGFLISADKLKIGEEELEFDGETIRRTDTRPGPSSLSEVSTPALITKIGHSAGIRIGGPVQYFEKLPDGSFHLQQTNDDSPETPHYQFTFTPQSTDNGYQLDCVLDLAVLQSRAKIPGVDLDVGRPEIAIFHDALPITVEKGKWICLFERSAVGNYRLLILVRAVPYDGKTAQVVAPRSP